MKRRKFGLNDVSADVPPPDESERRTSHRYAAASAEAWLGWAEDGGFATGRARIVNISQGGAMLDFDRLPPEGAKLWLAPDGTAAPEWTEADLVAAHPARKKRFLIRLSFPGACPYELFRDIVYGSEALGHRNPGPSSSEFDGRYWK